MHDNQVMESTNLLYIGQNIYLMWWPALKTTEEASACPGNYFKLYLSKPKTISIRLKHESEVAAAKLHLYRYLHKPHKKQVYCHFLLA